MRAREWIASLVLAFSPAIATAQPEPIPESPVETVVYEEPTADWFAGRWWVRSSAEFGWTSARSWPDAVKLRPFDLVGQRVPSLTLPRNDTRHNLQMGFGFNGGLWLGDSQQVGLDLGFLLYPGPVRGINGYTTGAYVHFPNGPDQSAPILVKFPDAFADFAMPMPATATDLFTTVDLNLRGGGKLTPSLRVDLLLGYRYASVEDQLYLGTENTGGTYTDPYGNQTSNDAYKQNRMTVENSFHGGQAGVEAAYRSQMFDITWAAKLAYGGQTTKVGASGVFLYPNMPMRTETETRAAFLPSFNGRFGVRLSDGCTAFVGYNFLYWDRVSRFGDAFAPGGGPIPGSPFWVQSVSLGFDLRF
ncbi:MAG: BBP7 family outer membrane beta-barrel protein [Gemmataceae bacterium]